jgi:Sec-independent protein translocase protein TatA
MLSGNQQPDHWTLSEFRRRHLSALGDLFVQTVQLAQAAGLVKLGQVAIDGTKIKAYASKHAAMSYGRMKVEEERLRREVERYFHEAETTDQEEGGRHGRGGSEELPERLRTAQRRLQAIREAKRALEEEARERARAEQVERRRQAEDRGKTYRPRKDPLDAQPKARAQRNFTDPDSRIMVNGDKAFVQAYNAQAAVDTANQIIVAAELTNQAGDVGEMAPLVEQVEETMGRRPGEVLADAGYWSEKNVQFLIGRGIGCLIPPDKVRHRMWREENPPPPPPSPGASLREKMRYALALPENRERYRMREKTAEPVFGQIKEGRGLRQFLLRGKEKVRALWRLDCAAHNVLKLWRAGVSWEPRWATP